MPNGVLFKKELVVKEDIARGNSSVFQERNGIVQQFGEVGGETLPLHENGGQSIADAIDAKPNADDVMLKAEYASADNEESVKNSDAVGGVPSKVVMKYLSTEEGLDLDTISEAGWSIGYATVEDSETPPNSYDVKVMVQTWWVDDVNGLAVAGQDAYVLVEVEDSEGVLLEVGARLMRFKGENLWTPWESVVISSTPRVADSTFYREDHLDKRDQTSPVGNMPIVVRPDGYIDESFVSISSGVVWQTIWTPATGAEYPSPTTDYVNASMWIISFPTDGETYIFTTGSLTGRTCKSGDILMLADSTATDNSSWSLSSVDIGSEKHLKTDGTNFMLANVDMGDGTHKIVNLAKGVADADGANTKQVNDVDAKVDGKINRIGDRSTGTQSVMLSSSESHFKAVSANAGGEAGITFAKEGINPSTDPDIPAWTTYKNADGSQFVVRSYDTDGLTPLNELVFSRNAAAEFLNIPTHNGDVFLTEGNYSGILDPAYMKKLNPDGTGSFIMRNSTQWYMENSADDDQLLDFASNASTGSIRGRVGYDDNRGVLVGMMSNGSSGSTYVSTVECKSDKVQVTGKPLYDNNDNPYPTLDALITQLNREAHHLTDLDFNTAITGGHYYVTGTHTNAPIAGAGTWMLEVIVGTSAELVQKASKVEAGSIRTFERNQPSGVWVELLTSSTGVTNTELMTEGTQRTGRGLPSSGSNLNTVTDGGIYVQTTDTGAANGFNYPTNIGGVLQVDWGDQVLVQRYTSRNNTTTPGSTWIRGRYNNSWSGWALADGSDRVKKSGDTMTGDLTIQKSSPTLKLHKTADIQHSLYRIGESGDGFLGSGYSGVTGNSPDYTIHSYTGKVVLSGNTSPDAKINGISYTMWNAGNDGAGSGLDADKLDGKHAESFMVSEGATVLNTLTKAGSYAGTFTDNPVGSDAVGTVVVLTHSGTGRTSQVFVDSNAKLFTRYSGNIGANWGAWQQYGAMEYDSGTNTLNITL